MSLISYASLKDRLRAELWPPLTANQVSAEARSLRVAHDGFFLGAVTDLQRWVPCLHVNNVTLWEFSETFYECAKSLVDAPSGVVSRVYTIIDQGDTDDWCSKVHYYSEKFKEVEAVAKRAFEHLVLNASEGGHIGNGVRYADPSTDSSCGRARSGLWAIRNHKLYLAPWIQSNEKVVVEWDGIKDTWENDDLLNQDHWGTTVGEAIKAYVLWREAMAPWGCKTDAPVYERDYANKLADLIWECRRKTEQQLEDGPELNRLPTKTELEAEQGPTQLSLEVDIEVIVALDGSEAVILWDEPDVDFDPETARYLVYRDDVVIATLTTDNLSYTDVDIVQGQTYTYAVFLHYDAN